MPMGPCSSAKHGGIGRVHKTHNNTVESRIYQDLRNLAVSPRDCKDRDALQGSTQMRLAVTYAEAMRDSSSGQSFVPWLLWNQFYRNHGQQDAQEFVQDLLGYTNAPNLFPVFCGRNDPDLICQNSACGEKTPVTGTEDFITLPVDIKRQESLQGAMNAFLRDQEPITMEGWSCPHCGVQRHPRKQNRITRYPAMLFVHLKRFQTIFREDQPGSYQEIYLNHHVLCEEEIKLNSITYRLRAKIYHQGNSLGSGHYYTVCRHEHATGNWWYYNDICRRVARPEDERPSNARVYLCFYERVTT